MTEQSSSQSPGQPPASREPVEVRPAPGAVWTIERTGKTWKLLLLVGVVLMLAGLGLGALAFDVRHMRFDRPTPLTFYAGAALALAGVVLMIVGRIGAWWNHG
jgi:hypothetical protein